jgi:hypothetical protein
MNITVTRTTTGSENNQELGMATKTYIKADEIQIKGNKIFSQVRKKWLCLTPEERVRQEYLLVLTREYGYSLDQMDEEINVTGRGSVQARANAVHLREISLAAPSPRRKPGSL